MMKEMIKQYQEYLLELLYPNVCPFCGKISIEGICKQCIGKIQYVQEPLCKKCGKPIKDEQEEYCLDCKEKKRSFDQGKALWIHRTPVKQAIYKYKYHNRRIYSRIFAEELYRVYQDKLLRWDVQAIIPIPLHKKRKKMRGFNQTEEIAKKLEEKTGIPMLPDLLVRVKATVPQKKLESQKRNENISNAFRIRRGREIPRRILLIDDIYTTGSTINEAAKILKLAGAEHVYFLTISIGQGF